MVATQSALLDAWESLSALGEITSAQVDEEHLFELLYRQTVRLTHLNEEEATFFLARLNPERNILNFDLYYERGTRLPPSNLPLGQGFTSWVVHHNCPLLTADLIADQARFGYEVVLTDREREHNEPPRACLAVPLRRGGEVAGVLSVQSLQPGVLTEDHVAMLAMWSGPIAIALDNARLVEALRHQAAELRARNEELGAFAHTVAHNIKNPLQSVLGYARVSLKRFDQLDGESLRDNLNNITRAGEKLNNIVDELMLLAGIGALSGARAEKLQMGEIVAEACSRLVDLVEDYSAEIVMPDVWPSAAGYGPWVEEIWANYISNAIKYGGKPPRVELGATVEGPDLVRFWVRDNGAGLAAEAQERLFTPFERLDQANVQGHGLGLSIVRRIADKLDGQVSVESIPGKGCTFSFTLPVRVANPADSST